MRENSPNLRRLRYIAALLVLGGYLATIGYGFAADLSAMDVSSLLQLANGANPAMRIAATQELFGRGPKILPELRQAGAKPMQTISPPRGDVIYTLLRGDINTNDSGHKWFGLHVEADVSAQDVERMGQRYGFVLSPDDAFNSTSSPACYVELQPGHNLASTLKKILINEPSVKTVNLDIMEHGPVIRMIR